MVRPVAQFRHLLAKIGYFNVVGIIRLLVFESVVFGVPLDLRELLLAMQIPVVSVVLITIRSMLILLNFLLEDDLVLPDAELPLGMVNSILERVSIPFLFQVLSYEFYRLKWRVHLVHETIWVEPKIFVCNDIMIGPILRLVI